MKFDLNFTEIVGWLSRGGLRILVVIVIAVVLIRLTQIISSKLIGSAKKRRTDSEYVKRMDTLHSVTRFVLKFTILLIAAIMIMQEVGIKIGPLIATAGIVGVALGFGAQSLVKDIISGFFIFLEDQIRVGDVVEVAGKSGIVERMNLKMTVLRDLSGNVHFIPNGHIEVVTNMTKGYSRYVFDIGVAYRENVDEVTEVMKGVDEELRADPEFKNDILEPLEILGLDQFGDSALMIKARTTTRPIKQWRVAREFNRRLKKAFDERNIEIPYPHITLYMGKDKQNQSPPLGIVLENPPKNDR
jgi:small-conductance mechanosensitive channel